MVGHVIGRQGIDKMRALPDMIAEAASSRLAWLSHPPESETYVVAVFDFLCNATIKTVDPKKDCGRVSDMLKAATMVFAGHEGLFSLATEIEGLTDDNDLVATWLWVAASYGSQPAQVAIATRLLDEAAGPKRLPKTTLVHQSLSWLRLAGRPSWECKDELAKHPTSVASPDGFTVVPDPAMGCEGDGGDLVATEVEARRAMIEGSKAGASVEATQPPLKAHPSLIRGGKRKKAPRAPSATVLDGIGDAGSREGAALVSRYGILTKPIPLVPARTSAGDMAASLAARFPWAVEACRAVAGMVAVSASVGVRYAKVEPILLVGPPGTGKSAFAKEICLLLGIPHMLISAGGSSEGRAFEGTGRQWGNPLPGLPALAMRMGDGKNPCGNVCLVLDEVEKGTKSMYGSMRDAVLGLLETRSTPKYYDTCLMGHVDVSHMNWVATANSVEGLGAAFLSRWRVVPFPAPPASMFSLCLERMIETEARHFGIDRRMMPNPDCEARAWMSDVFTRSGGNLRSLRQAYDVWQSEETLSMAARPN